MLCREVADDAHEVAPIRAVSHGVLIAVHRGGIWRVDQFSGGQIGGERLTAEAVDCGRRSAVGSCTLAKLKWEAGARPTNSHVSKEEEKVAELRQQLQAERGRRVRAERSERRQVTLFIMY